MVVPLQVVIGATSYDEGVATPEMVAEALREFTPVSTSRPTPAAMLETSTSRRRPTAPTEIVSIHLSARHERHLRVRRAGRPRRARCR